MEIDRCPCCSGSAVMRARNKISLSLRVYWIECSYCELRTAEYSELEQAIWMWNRRAPAKKEKRTSAETKLGCILQSNEQAHEADEEIRR